MVRIHGNYCGPNWTAGQAKPASMIDQLPYVKPTDRLDAACLEHDRSCSKGGCTSAADTRLARKALAVALITPTLRDQALLIAAAMTVASRTRGE